MTAKKALGDFGERVAARHLEARGMAILARNVRVQPGEIDLVAADSGDIVCVEVRTRRAEVGAAAESMTAAKIQRMWRCAVRYAETNDLDPARLRIDAVVIDLAPNGSVASIEHLRGLEVPD